MKTVASLVAAMDISDWTKLRDEGHLTLGEFSIESEDVIVSQTPKRDVVIESRNALSVALDHELTLELKQEGQAREVVSRIQRMRKEQGFEVTDRITLHLHSESNELLIAIKSFEEYIADEVLANVIEYNSLSESLEVQIDDQNLLLSIQTV